MEVNKIKTKYTISVVAVITILFVTVFAVNDSFATSMNLSKTGYQDKTTQMQAKLNTDKLTTIQDNEELEVKGASGNNLFEAESNDEGKSIDPKFVGFNYINPTHAKSIAVDFIHAKTSDAKSVLLEGENGNPVYSVDVMKNGQSYEVNVDAISGKVLIVSQDGIDGSVINTSEIDDVDDETNDD
jgi:uncharacterized membrane protein YkoI